LAKENPGSLGPREDIYDSRIVALGPGYWPENGLWSLNSTRCDLENGPDEIKKQFLLGKTGIDYSNAY
jgi:hypothetical protein